MPLEVVECKKCGKVVAEPKELIRIRARVFYKQKPLGRQKRKLGKKTETDSRSGKPILP